MDDLMEMETFHHQKRERERKQKKEREWKKREIRERKKREKREREKRKSEISSFYERVKIRGRKIHFLPSNRIGKVIERGMG